MLRPEAVADLRQRQAAAFLDGLDAERAVRVAAGQHDADRQFALIFGERAEEDIDRLALGLVSAQLQAQLAVHHGHDVIGWTDVQLVGLQLNTVGRRLDRHRGVAAPVLPTSALTWPRAKCVITTKLSPVSADMARNRASNASKPPAEAPMPTIGNLSCEAMYAPVGGRFPPRHAVRKVILRCKTGSEQSP